VTTRTKTAILAGRLLYQTSYDNAVARQGAWQNTLKEVFKNVDFIALPTLQTPPPSAIKASLAMMARFDVVPG